MWWGLQVTLRCSNQDSYDGTPYRTIVFDCITTVPWWKDEPDTEPTRDVGGYIPNATARRRVYEMIIRDATVREDETGELWDFGTIEHHTGFLYAEHLWLVQVTGSPRVYRDSADISTALPYWLHALTLPRKVRREMFDIGDELEGEVSPVLVLEDATATTGCVIT